MNATRIFVAAALAVAVPGGAAIVAPGASPIANASADYYVGFCVDKNTVPLFPGAHCFSIVVHD